MHVNELKSFKKKSKSMIKKKNLNEKKKSFVWMFRIDLKKNKQNKLLRQKTKKQFTHHRAIQNVIAVF